MRKVLKPAGYHGHGKRSKYFEGWYVKLVDANQDARLAVIPGVFLAPEENGPHEAFVQVLDGRTGRSWYVPYPMSEFTADPEHFAVQVGPNRFSTGGVRLDLPEVGLSGTVGFGRPLDPWPVSATSPGAMGWYAWMPFMECYHGVVSFRHDLDGSLYLDGAQLDFTGGKGYIEKDWGRSFPRAYTWMQTNHFDTHDRASLLASVAHIPWLGSYFIGFISGFWLDGRLHRFATYTGARKFLRVTDEQVELIFKNPSTELRLLAGQAAGTALKSPISGEMTGKVNESLQARVQVEFLEKGRRVFEGTGRNAGLEVAGEVELLVES